MACFAVLAAVSVSAITPAAADAIPYPNSGAEAPIPTFTATSTGNLLAYFYGSSASFDETLGALDVTTNTLLGTGVFQNHATLQGELHNFGQVTKGDTFVFFINVLTTGDTFYSDPSRNTDGYNHAYSTTYSGGTADIPAGTFVGFEDLSAGALYSGQPDYNDETFVFTNTTFTSTVPLPASAPMFGAALLALGAVGYGVTRKTAFATA